jgi:multidrug resistance efflux pump
MTDDAARRPPPPIPGKVIDDLESLMQFVEQARPVPLSSNAMVNRDEVLTRLEAIFQALPEELRAARWMVREREAYITRTNEKAREVIAKAKERSEELVSESHIVEEAVAEANTLVRNAEAEARRIRLEAEDLADLRLSEMETFLSSIVEEIRDVRAQFHEARPPQPEPPVSL